MVDTVLGTAATATGDATAGGDAAAQAAAAEAAKTAAAATQAQETPEAKAAREAEAAKNETPEAKAAREKAEADAKAKEGAPEKYEDFKLPDGVQIDAKVLEEVLPVFKELGLSQEKAQKLIDLQTKFNVEAAEGAAKAWLDQNERWVAEAKSDKEIGGDKFNENAAMAAKAMGVLGTPGLKDMMNATGVGNHPEMIRLFAKLGRMVSDDKLHLGGAAGGAEPKTAAEVIYPSTQK